LDYAVVIKSKRTTPEEFINDVLIIEQFDFILGTEKDVQIFA